MESTRIHFLYKWCEIQENCLHILKAECFSFPMVCIFLQHQPIKNYQPPKLSLIFNAAYSIHSEDLCKLWFLLPYFSRFIYFVFTVKLQNCAILTFSEIKLWNKQKQDNYNFQTLFTKPHSSQIVADKSIIFFNHVKPVEQKSWNKTTPMMALGSVLSYLCTWWWNFKVEFIGQKAIWFLKTKMKIY